MSNTQEHHERRFHRLLLHLRKFVIPAIESIGYDDPIFVFSHIDADGLSSATILLHILHGLDKPFILKFLPQIVPENFEELWNTLEPRYAIFLDLGTDTPADIIKKTTTLNTGIILDHHATAVQNKMPNIIISNPNLMGIDGSTEISTSSLVASLATLFRGISIPDGFLDYLGLVGALGDSQDIGTSRSLIGINAVISENCIRNRTLEAKRDFLIIGRSIKPLYQVLAEWFIFEIPGITGSYNGAHDFLVSQKLIDPDTDPNKILWDNLPEEKQERVKKKLIEMLLLKYPGQFTIPKLDKVLTGYTYKYRPNILSIGFYGRDLAVLLNACGKMKSPHTAIRMLLDPNNDDAKKQVLIMYDRYRAFISEAIKKAKENIESYDRIALYDGREKIHEEITSTLSSILAISLSNQYDLVAVMAYSIKPIVKVSLRKTERSKIGHLGKLIGEITKKIPNSSGGGHENAAGIYIYETHIDTLVEMLQNATKNL